MSETKHTPGPWYIRYEPDRDRASDGNRIIQSSQFGICTVWDSEARPNDAEANTLLIAAAPDLLDVLERADIHGWFDAPENETQAHFVEEIRAAIAKAKG